MHACNHVHVHAEVTSCPYWQSFSFLPMWLDIYRYIYRCSTEHLYLAAHHGRCWVLGLFPNYFLFCHSFETRLLAGWCFFLVMSSCSYSHFLDESSLPYDIVEVHLLYDEGLQTSKMTATMKALLPSLMIHQVQKPSPVPDQRRPRRDRAKSRLYEMHWLSLLSQLLFRYWQEISLWQMYYIDRTY